MTDVEKEVAPLRKEVKEAQIERDILKGGEHPFQKRQQKYEFMLRRTSQNSYR